MRWAQLLNSLLHPSFGCAVTGSAHDAPQRLEDADLKQLVDEIGAVMALCQLQQWSCGPAA